MQARKLLIADSDTRLVEELAKHFIARGYEVKTAYDALTILKLVHLDTPDAFCLGIDLKCDNGVCVCEMLSQERRFCYLPAVLLTARADDRLMHDCHDLRAIYVPKGPQLAERIEDVLVEAESHEPLVYADN